MPCISHLRIWSVDGVLGNEDMEQCFYLPERIRAGILWTSGGYVEYKFPNQVPRKRVPKRLSFSGEICSEAPGFGRTGNQISLSGSTEGVRHLDQPRRYGRQKGRLNPPVWPDGSTQYGFWVTWEIDSRGCRINGEPAGDTTIEELCLMDAAFVKLRLGNKKDARYAGGFNLFGKHFGNYDQDLIMTIEY